MFLEAEKFFYDFDLQHPSLVFIVREFVQSIYQDESPREVFQ
jgi:hypothetical protein